MKPEIPKPEIPTCSPVVWRELYATAEKFCALHPWEFLGDEEVIGVHDPVSGERGYGIVMGGAGTLFGYALYMGANGFDYYRRLMQDEFDIERDDSFAFQNLLKLELVTDDFLEPPDMAVHKTLGLTIPKSGLVPQFRSARPLYLPWYLEEWEVRFLTIGLAAATRHMVRVIKRSVRESIGEKGILVYRALQGSPMKFTHAWEPLPPPPPIPSIPIDLQRISKLRARNLKRDSPWEAGIFCLLHPLFDGKRPYYARMAAVCQQSNGYAFFVEALAPETGNVPSLADAILSSVEKSGFLPDVIYVADEPTRASLRPVVSAIGSEILFQEELDTIAQVRNGLKERFEMTR